ncbi:OmpW/AlkL family protein [Gilvimarinus algae]|uniref:OmpW family outer membrane protein n=1 Tax=Gilvimarinus algae TaxID=3058037 RepID=A0ABT8TJD7_9GAMM|nr:OmpW family outer membrane protein [Gilvimarinus sp. SDUM040014]MDO3382452.1 OmpW family outer membrane protein [Gilvimarinus sp. SDUM040014]
MKFTAVPAAFTLAVFSSFTTSAQAAGYQAGDVLVRAGVTSVQPDSKRAGVFVEALGGDTPLALSVDNDSQLGLNLVYLFTRNWAFEVLAATPFEHDVTIHDPQGVALGVFDTSVDGATLAEVKHLPPTISALYYFSTDNNFKPYVGAGINYTVFFDEAFQTGPESLGFNSLELDDSWGYALQFGADIQLGEHWLLNASARYIDIETTATFKIGEDIAGSSEVEINPVVYSLMLGYRF